MRQFPWKNSKKFAAMIIIIIILQREIIVVVITDYCYCRMNQHVADAAFEISLIFCLRTHTSL